MKLLEGGLDSSPPRNMSTMKSVMFYGAFFGCFVMKTTNAQLGTKWTTPVIGTINGEGTVSTAVPEDGSSFPTLQADGTMTINYVIVSQTPADVFNIDAGSGLLALAAGQSLDYETNTQYVLVVTANDGTSTGTATVTINIEDVNDNAPAFPAAGYSTCVADATAAATTVLTLSTTDADTTTTENAISAMTISAGNTNTDFAINAAGVLTTVNALDMSTTAEYSLEVKAVDSDTPALTGTTTVSITVSDSCNRGTGIFSGGFAVTLLLGLLTSLV